MKIIVIEPDAILAETYQKALQASGHSVRVSGDGQTAVDMIDDETPDVILLEIQLAGHNGIEFLYELRSYDEWLDLPVIILSNVPPSEFVASKNIIKNYLKIDKYLYKPTTSLAKILDTLEAVNHQSVA